MDITILISFDGSSTSRHTICKLKASPDIRSAWYSGCVRFHHVNCAFRVFFYLTEYVGNVRDRPTIWTESTLEISNTIGF